jgi:hypothetical protein
LIHIEILYKYHFNNAECIQIEQYNYNRVIYYKELANQLIAKIIKFMNGHVPIYTVESVTIALLYYMKTGYMYEGIEVIPPDEYLRDMLPPIRDLNKMGFDKKHVTKGQQLITRTYAIAATKAISMHDMALVLPDVDNNVELMRATRQKTTTTIK